MRLIPRLHPKRKRQAFILPFVFIKHGSLRRAGFTLVELVMTIVVAGIIAIPLSLLVSQHVESAWQSEDLTVAGNLATREMERVNNLDYASITSASFSQYAGYNYDLIRTVTYAQGNPSTPESLKQITVEVKKSGEATVLVRLTSYIARNINYGL